MIIDRGGMDGYDSEYLGEYTYKHELRSQDTRHVRVECDGHGNNNGYDIVMIHLVEYASVNQVPKALVRSMLAFKLPRSS